MHPCPSHSVLSPSSFLQTPQTLSPSTSQPLQPTMPRTPPTFHPPQTLQTPTHLHHTHLHPPYTPQILSPSAPQPPHTSQHPPSSHSPPTQHLKHPFTISTTATPYLSNPYSKPHLMDLIVLFTILNIKLYSRKPYAEPLSETFVIFLNKKNSKGLTKNFLSLIMVM